MRRIKFTELERCQGFSGVDVDPNALSEKTKTVATTTALYFFSLYPRLAPTLPEKLEQQRDARVLEGKRDDVWRAFDQASRDVDVQKDTLLDEISKRLEQTVEQEKFFTLRWRLS